MARKVSPDAGLLEQAEAVIELLADRAQEAVENEGIRRNEAEIRAQLARLGGKQRDDDDIAWEGKKIVLPTGTTLRQNIRFLERKEEELEKETQYVQNFNYRPWDGAYAMWNVLKRQFGGVGHKDSRGMWGQSEPPKMITIPTGFGQTEQVPWGRFELPAFPGCMFETDQFNDREKGPLFRVVVTGPKKYKYEIQGVFLLIETELAESSIYRGKAFDGQVMPQFLNVFSVDRRLVVYSDDVMAQLEANVWAQLRHTEVVARQGIPLKRAVLLHGPYGTGKTLACMLTAQEADAAGWTFIQARAGRDDLGVVLQTAKLYEPSVVFFEDIDTIASSDEEGITRLLDDFDGIGAKGTKILMVLTTNHPERIHKGMARPGRLDAIIEINELDMHGVEKLIRTRIEEQLADDIDWAAVFKAAEGYKPAFVTEGADRTIRYLIARHGNVDGHKIDTQDLVYSMQGLRDQYDMMIGAKDQPQKDNLSEALGDVVRKHYVDMDSGMIELRA